MTAQRVCKIHQDVIIAQGDYKQITFVTYDLDGNRVDITGAEITYQVRKHERANVALITKTVGSGIVIDPDQTNNRGEWTATLDPADTADLEGDLYHEASMSISSKPVKSMSGEFKVEVSVIQ